MWCFIAFRNVSNDKSHVIVERQAWYEIEIDGKPVLYYTVADSDSIFKDLAEKRDTAITRTIAAAQWTNRHWWWPSCKGTITALLDSLDQPTFSPLKVVEMNLKKAKRRLRDLNKMSDEMEYFFSTHSVYDEGYELVTDFYEDTSDQTADLEGVIAQLEECLKATNVTIRHKADYRAIYKNKKGKQQTDTCYLVSQGINDDDDANLNLDSDSNHNALLTTFQLKAKKTPKGVKTVSYRKGHESKLHLSYAVQPRYVAKEDTLDGFALRVTPQHGVQLGVWKNGKYKGEQMEYNSQRIYGIDLSRFQHEKGKKKYAIKWDKLRITSLGTLTQHRVSGTVDYPVSFVYVKATEGTTVKNKYYAGDYTQAKKHGMKVGSYHFFSTTTPAVFQARWFLKHSFYKPGDLPPVLDVEPSNAQIKAMGGVDKLFNAIRLWLNSVKSETGVKPILYISQIFVNKYLSQAPDLKQNYQVWIARYGEYKPDVHMLYWQLCPDGTVRGITPKVDINVFNGYQDKYDEFVGSLK